VGLNENLGSVEAARNPALLNDHKTFSIETSSILGNIDDSKVYTAIDNRHVTRREGRPRILERLT
jgi:rRNA pseudouridine-1189 N-methylase Emg1 (Nep1/Mra1 family)